jgi:hypothetical protein
MYKAKVLFLIMISIEGGMGINRSKAIYPIHGLAAFLRRFVVEVGSALF